MKALRICLLLAICFLLPGLPLYAVFQANAVAQEWPRPSQPKMPPLIMIKWGEVLAQPAFLFVDRVMTRVDFLQYGCASIWHPVYRISFGILELGYAGTLTLSFYIIRQAIRRRNARTK